MKKILTLTAVMALSLLSSRADNSRYVTITTTTTNSISILEGETVEIVDANPSTGVTSSNNWQPVCTVQKDGFSFRGTPRTAVTIGTGTTVAGPATISLASVP